MSLSTRKLGRQGLEVSAIGLGCMGMSQSYGPADEAESIATLPARRGAGERLGESRGGAIGRRYHATSHGGPTGEPWHHPD